MLFNEFCIKKKDGYKAIASIIDTSKEVVKGKKLKPKEKMIYLKELDELNMNKDVRELKFPKHIKLKPVMVRQEGDHPNRMLIAGSSLCGKSFLATQIAQDYNKSFPDNKVAYVSFIDDEKNINDKNVKNLIKITPNEDILEEDNELNLEEFHDKLLILDDYENTDKHILRALETFRNKVINSGRHHNIDIIVCRHGFCQGVHQSALLSGLFQIVGFPYSASKGGFQYYLKEKLKLKSDVIDKIMSVPSRWVLVNITMPPYVLHEHGCFFI